MWSKAKKLRSRLFRKRQNPIKENDEESPSIRIVGNESFNRNAAVSSESNNLPLLYGLSKSWAWPAVEFRCRTHPEEASVEYRDGAGDNCLHRVCYGKPPLETVNTLLAACPELAEWTNRDGSLPLHVACSYRASGDVIRRLVHAYPKGAGHRNRTGSFPLHLLCDCGSSVDAMRAVLESKQGKSTLTALDGVYQRSCLLILNARKSITNFHRDIQVLRRERARGIIHGHEQDRHSSEHGPLRSMEFWEKASLLVWLEYNNRNDAELNCLPQQHDGVERDICIEKNIVHCCVGLHQCPTSVLAFAMLLHPHQLLEADSSGQLPLHIAASQPDSSRLFDVLSSSPQCAARARDSNGDLPIMLAIQSGKRWREGVGALLASYPESLEAMDLDDRLYPFIWCRLLELPHQYGASCLYECIKAKPNIVMRRT